MTLRTRIGLWFFALATLLLALFASALYLDARRRAYAALDARLEARAARYASLTEWDDGELEYEGEEEEAWPEPFAAGRIRAGLPGKEQVYLSPVLRGREHPALRLLIGRYTRTLGDTLPVRVLVTIASPRVEEDGLASAPLLTLTVIASERPLRAELAALASGLVLLCVPVGLLALGCAWFLSARISSQLAALAAAAGRIDPAVPGARLPLAGTGDALDALSARLNDAFARLQAALERQTRFTADAAHELKTPTAVIRTEAEVTLRRPRTPEAYRAALSHVHAAALRLGDSLDGLLLLARADAGVAVASPEPVALDELATELLAAHAEAARSRGLELDLVCEGRARVDGVKSQLRLALGNLLRNALDYSDGPGTVALRIARDGAAWRIEVRDHGIGIPAAHLPHVFERFYRVDAARSRRTGGAGLGLSLVQAIATLHGGAVGVESAPGEGSRFWLRLPAAEG